MQVQNVSHLDQRADISRLSQAADVAAVTCHDMNRKYYTGMLACDLHRVCLRRVYTLSLGQHYVADVMSIKVLQVSAGLSQNK